MHVTAVETSVRNSVDNSQLVLTLGNVYIKPHTTSSISTRNEYVSTLFDPVEYNGGMDTEFMLINLFILCSSLI